MNYLDEIKKLNRKKIDGSATREELIKLELLIKTSCIDERAIKLCLENDLRNYSSNPPKKNNKKSIIT